MQPCKLIRTMRTNAAKEGSKGHWRQVLAGIGIDQLPELAFAHWTSNQRQP